MPNRLGEFDFHRVDIFYFFGLLSDVGPFYLRYLRFNISPFVAFVTCVKRQIAPNFAICDPVAKISRRANQIEDSGD